MKRIFSALLTIAALYAACPTIESLDFTQEDICDGNDLVEICYEVLDTDGDSVYVEFQLNTVDTTIGLSTIYETVPGYFGPQLGWVAPGMHCFYWDAGIDLPGEEGCSYELSMDIFNETIDVLSIYDSIPYVDAEGVTYDGENLWVMGSVFGGATSTLAQIDPETHAVLHSGTISRSGGWADCCWYDDKVYAVGATGGGVGTGVQGRIFAFDPWTFAVVDSSVDPIFTGRFGQGIEYHDGWLWLNNTLGEVWRVDPVTLTADPSTPFMNVTDIYAASHGGADLFPDGLPDALEFELGSMWFLKNPDGGTNNILFRFDMAGNFLGEYILPTAETYGPEGLTFDGRCFWYTDHRSPEGSEGMVYRVCLWGCEDEDYYTGCIDTQDPEVTAICAYDTLLPGNTYTFEWDVNDYFEAGECSVYVEWCSGSEGYEITGFPPYSLDYEIPFGAAGCDSITFIYRGMDEYCHRDEDTCRFAIGGGFDVTHIGPFPTDSGFYACDDQPIEFEINSVCPLDFAASYITIDGTDTYYLTNPAYTWIAPDLTLNFGAGYWSSGTHTYIAHFEDECGNSYDSTFTVMFDLDPPFFTFWGPTDTLAPEETTSVFFDVDDALSGIGDINVHVTNDCGSFTYTFGEIFLSGDTLFTPPFMCPGTNYICIVAEDIPDYCPPNEDSVCFSFENPYAGGIFANVAEPVDRNGDMMVISNCDDQRIAFRINSEYPIDSSTIEIDVCGSSIAWPSPLLSFSGDTLIYTPDTLWHDGATCAFCLNSVADIYGTALSSPVCGNIVIDLSPPLLTGATPSIGDTIFGETASVSASFTDFMCTGAEIVEYRVNAPLSGISFTGSIFPVDLVGLVGGDSVSICVDVEDNCADYCDPNMTTICWGYPVITGGVYGWVEYPVDSNGDGRTITACAEGVITIGLISNIDTDGGLRMSVTETGDTYYEDDLMTAISGDTTFVTLDPAILGFDWSAYSGEYVHFVLDSAVDIYGFALESPVADSFLVDLDPPVISGFMPTGEIHSADTWVTASAFDSICGAVPLDSIVATIYPSGSVHSFSADSGLVTGLLDGDSIHVCAYSIDGCQDYCDGNDAVSCWDFTVSMGTVYADILSPTDTNTDGRIITTCADQGIVWDITHTDSMVASEFYVTVDGMPYNWPDHLLWRNDSLVFTPTEPWEHGDSIHFCIDAMEDITGTRVTDEACGYFIVDLEPPLITWERGPTEGSTITSDSTGGEFSAFDDICGDVPIDSIRVTTTSGLSAHFFDSLYSVTGLTDADTALVCVYAHDDCEDVTCLDTNGVLCLTYFVRIGAVSASVVRPVDTNGDTRIVSSCPGDTIRWEITSDYPIVDSTITVTVDGATYTYPDHLVWDGTYLEFVPDMPFTSGDTIDFCIDFAEDETGAEITDFCSSYIIDRDPPRMLSHSPMTFAYTDSVLVDANFFDDVCDSNITISNITAMSYPTGISLAPTAFPFSFTGIEDGDSVLVCAEVADMCYDYCASNVDTICFSFTGVFGEPRAELVLPRDSNGDGRRITACGDQGIVMTFTDSHGMSEDGIHFTVDGAEYRTADLASTWFDPDTTVLWASWNPTGIWSHGEWVVVNIDSAYNRLGDPLVTVALDSFLVDLEPPDLAYTGPTGTHTADMASISATATDDICPTAIRDSMTIHIEPAGLHINRGSSWVDTTLSGLLSGDNVTICLYARDNCADTCGFNSSDTCISFDVLIGSVTATLIEPVDLTGDGRVITTCADQQIIWRIGHSLPIDPASIEVTVDGSTYGTGDAELELTGDTLIFSGDWTDGADIAFSLNTLCDTLANCISAPVSGDFTVDLSPPWFTDLEPPTGGFMAGDTSVAFSATLYDSVCTGEDFLDSLVINVFTEGGTSHIVEMDIPTALIGWSGMDSVHACMYLSDNCADYCLPNDTVYCWEYVAYNGAPIGEFVLPRDANGDGRRISACSDQGVRFVVSDPAGFTGTDIAFAIDGMPYTEDDATISSPDTATLVIEWMPLTEWESGDSLHVILTETPNVHGIPLSEPVEGYYIIDTEPPIIDYTGAEGAITADSFFYSFDVTDEICGLAHIDSVLLWRNGISEPAEQIGTIDGLTGGDTLTLCLFAHDFCADTCGYNSSQLCIDITVELGEVTAHVIDPGGIPGMPVSACIDQELVWFIEHELALDTASIEVSIDGLIYSMEDRELDLWGDTLTFSPTDPDFWSDGDMVIYCLNHVMDITGADISQPECDTILFDLSPPQFSDFSPIGDISDNMPEITTLIADVYSGVNPDSISVTLDGTAIPFDWDGARLTATPTLPLECGIEHTVVIHAADEPDLCASNTDSLILQFTVACLPNLHVDTAWVDPPEIVEGDSAMLTGIIGNEGADIPSFGAGIYLEGEELGYNTFNDITVGWDELVTKLIADLSEGEYEICITADPDDEIEETDETDNTFCTALRVVGAVCDAHPNPFTPNGDGIYDSAVFEHPGQGTDEVTLQIFDLENRLVDEIEGTKPRWDGKDQGGNPMPKGVYLYILLMDGDRICHGTIYLAR